MVPWREAGPLDHHDDVVDSDQQVVNKKLSLSGLQVGMTRLLCESARAPDVNRSPKGDSISLVRRAQCMGAWNAKGE